MLLKLSFIGVIIALVTCITIYVITPRHKRRATLEWMEGSEATAITAWSYATAEYVVVNPSPFGRVRWALHNFLYH